MSQEQPSPPETSTAPPAVDGTEVSELSYEQARDELIAIVARIESGSVPLEESMLLWERGEALAAHCQSKLDAAQSQLDASTEEPDAGV
ncbi:MAG TPA: exodeoxyribonuclease VII small subunit [Ornithinimicrobium sp.]|uniref:exodeoxyribonuclease VII small subunit n=1 Tax=Ornithinimicrobium sp. TaxID=1977084 RepID=UPI002B492ECC|nr:exodeoxyribonuclease VII small subunit [Ornithinimicrobium sp.]HKJ11094.1 exodeoxyribonuclease VII small subunit [Ornithinimicrobium sp.]